VAGIGLLPHSNCVHVDAEPERLAAYTRLVGDGMPGGYAAEDGAALDFDGTALRRVVSSRPHARAYRVDPGAEPVALEAEYLGRQPVAAW